MPAGRKITSGLFKELRKDGVEYSEEAPYSLEDFREAFLEAGESTGYLCALRMLTECDHSERWQEWRRLFSSPPLSNILEEWKDELAIRVIASAERAVALGLVDPKDFPRVRYILDGGLVKKEAKRAGRPTKETKDRLENITRAARGRSREDLDNVIEIGGSWKQKRDTEATT